MRFFHRLIFIFPVFFSIYAASEASLQNTPLQNTPLQNTPLQNTPLQNTPLQILAFADSLNTRPVPQNQASDTIQGNSLSNIPLAESPTSKVKSAPEALQTVFPADSLPDKERPVLVAPTPMQTTPERPFRYTFDGSPTRKTTQIDVGRALIYGGGYSAAIAASMIYQYQQFWSDRLSFRIIDDGALALDGDKGGHVFAGYFMSKFATDVLLTSGISEDLATIGGGLMGLGYQFFVEVQDGYGNGWGFSPSDMIANAVGSGLHIAQRFVPVMKHVKMKVDFYPSEWIGEKRRLGASNPIDDYSAWTWWLSFDVHGLLPEPAKAVWPSWLNLAVGYAARSLQHPDQSRRIILSLDYDLEKILPDGGAFWNWLRQYINILKLPAPAIEFGWLDDGAGRVSAMPVRAYLLFPFKIP